MLEACVSVRNVTKTFQVPVTSKGQSKAERFTALSNIDLDIRENEFISFLGPSGCGKTTLLKIIQGLIKQDEGSIYVYGQRVAGVPKEMGFVFQDVGLFPWRNVLDNVALGLQAQNVPRKERYERAMKFISMVGLEPFAKHFPYQLSGGMQQRAGLARALAIEPQILLMDEPFGALDAQTRETLQIELSRIWQELRTTVIFVTHDIDEAIMLSDRVVMFSANPGRIHQITEVNLPRPRWEYDIKTHHEALDIRSALVNLLKGGEVSNAAETY